ncbi:hypothetical protein [Micromonospora sp. CPCC 206061]|uniref:hypothetical protein n=1 Tax=Micromonospora sp. CPCC 206061 TaxID=3122410 RepID=UPI002FF2C2AD
MSDPSGLSPERIKHLELIQAIVSRLANHSFLIKGWTLTIAAAFFAVLANRLDWAIALVGLIPLVTFWFLDGVFVRNERRFRDLYNDVRKQGTTVELMAMDLRPYAAQNSWAAATFSTTMALFYGALVLVDAVLVVVAIARSA